MLKIFGKLQNIDFSNTLPWGKILNCSESLTRGSQSRSLESGTADSLEFSDQNYAYDFDQ